MGKKSKYFILILLFAIFINLQAKAIKRSFNEGYSDGLKNKRIYEIGFYNGYNSHQQYNLQDKFFREKIKTIKVKSKYYYNGFYYKNIFNKKNNMYECGKALGKQAIYNEGYANGWVASPNNPNNWHY